ncbi:uncharacterized protein LOC119357993 [Triticum dicoccoides]|uniref:uncharacterized protein LOC119357993 n=1 Tax=Triticum dicoccoides TaxID=85692 RepID=UPI00188F8484|nr:uncharacterized protein LOC119357993 [Triticum dicoccoides]
MRYSYCCGQLIRPDLWRLVIAVFFTLWTASDVPYWHSSSELRYKASLQNKGTVSCRATCIKEMEWLASLLQEFLKGYNKQDCEATSNLQKFPQHHIAAPLRGVGRSKAVEGGWWRPAERGGQLLRPGGRSSGGRRPTRCPWRHRQREGRRAAGRAGNAGGRH